MFRLSRSFASADFKMHTTGFALGVMDEKMITPKVAKEEPFFAYRGIFPTL